MSARSSHSSRSSRLNTKITVKHVRIDGAVQSVRFSRNHDRGVFSARTRGHAPIRVRFDDNTGKFVAGNRQGKVMAKTADVAFAKAVREIWAS